MPLQFGDQGLADSMLRGSGLGIEAARLQLNQQEFEARRQEIAREQALRERSQTFREDEYQHGQNMDAAARDSMLSEIDAANPPVTGTEADFFQAPGTTITPEMRKAPARAIEDTHKLAMSQQHHLRALQEESDRQWGMYRNLRKQGLARMVSPETYDKAVAAGVEWAPEDAPPERRPIDIGQVMQALNGGAGPAQMPDIMGPQMPQGMPGMGAADTSGLLRMDHTNLGMLGRVAGQKPKASTADWLAAGATPSQAASFARLGGTIDDVERFRAHKAGEDMTLQRETNKTAPPTDAEITSLMRSHPREFPDRQSATDYIVQKKAGLTNQLRAPNDETDDRGHAKWAAEALETKLKTAEDERTQAAAELKAAKDPNAFKTPEEIAPIQAKYDEAHAAVKQMREQLAGLYEGMANGTGGRNPPKNTHPARETKPQTSPGTDQGQSVEALMDANPPLRGETEDQYVQRIKAMRGVQR